MQARPKGYQFGHQDHPALILGNGPSLSNLNFDGISDFATFGMNAAYRHWQSIDWWPDYYSCLDLVLGESHIEAIADMINHAETTGVQQFLLRHDLIKRLGKIGKSRRVTCYERLLADAITPRLWDVTTGSHTLLWAESLGYTTVLLAGVDCDYVERVRGSKLDNGQLYLEEEAANPNYYFQGYQRKGDRYNIPNLTPDLHRRSWQNVASKLGISTVVVNLNAESRVDCFVPYSTPLSSLQGVYRANPEPALDKVRGSDNQNDPGTDGIPNELQRLSEYEFSASPETISLHLERRFVHSSNSTIRQLRDCFARNYVDWAICGHSEGSMPNGTGAMSGPSRVVQIYPQGARYGVSELERGQKPIANSLLLAVSDQFAPGRMGQLVKDIHTEFGAKTLVHRIQRLSALLIRQLARIVPWPVRAIDFKGHLEARRKSRAQSSRSAEG